MSHRAITLLALLSWPVAAGVGMPVQEPVDYDVVHRIKDEAFNRSQVAQLVRTIADVYGPRFSNSPAYNEATLWAREKFLELGVDAEVEPFGTVGLGWQNEYTSFHMMEPQYQTLIAYPVPWTRGTEGRIRSTAIHMNAAEIRSAADLEPYRTQVGGKIVFIAPARALHPSFTPDGIRFSREQLDDWASFRVLPEPGLVQLPRDEYDELVDGRSSEPMETEAIAEFLEKAGAAALVSPGLGTDQGAFDKGTVRVVGGEPIMPGEPKPMPHLIAAAEHYNRVVRLLDMGLEVELELEVRVRYDEDDLQDYNVVSQIAGGDLAHEIVIIGGHFDAESAGTGATDNGAGSAVVMEAMRILRAIDAHPRRTIRGILWGSEEAGLLGSRGYVRNHFIDLEDGTRRPDYDNFSVYFNTDWYGRFRGLFIEGNSLVAPIFRAWMEPFHDLGFAHLLPVPTGGTDSVSFNEAGLPGFKFLQDDLEYFTKTWHSNMDVYDRIVAADLMGNAAILASFAYHAAMRDEKIPRVDTPVISKRSLNR
ncbi:MAG TPA: M20/M25/M40 family metallo-hydrolase [Acidobacteriota bacterium]|nr:M20/M25/M40 family metallo-hydrolase [Acidobacteriota bacterium]